jgi:hypothetical protein
MNDPINEHDLVVLVRDLPEAGLTAGETGAVVHIYKQGEAFEVEFPAAREREMGGVVTVERPHLLKLKSFNTYLSGTH